MAVKLDIEQLTEAELIELNHKIIARLRFIREAKAHRDMMEFHIGERVSFTPPDQETVHGIVTRFNKKSVSVVTEDGRRWTVHPSFLEKNDDERAKEARPVGDLSKLNQNERQH